MERIEVGGIAVEMEIVGSGPPLLFLHGGDYVAQNRAFLDRLAGRFRVIAPRHPGFGDTPRPAWFSRKIARSTFATSSRGKTRRWTRPLPTASQPAIRPPGSLNSAFSKPAGIPAKESEWITMRLFGNLNG